MLKFAAITGSRLFLETAAAEATLSQEEPPRSLKGTTPPDSLSFCIWVF